MAITKAVAEYKGDWLALTFEDNLSILWSAFAGGYGVDRWTSPNLYEYQYGVWKAGNNNAKIKIGVFDTPEEVVAMLKLILASEEFNDGQ
jgi:hypothetical protein